MHVDQHCVCNHTPRQSNHHTHCVRLYYRSSSATPRIVSSSARTKRISPKPLTPNRARTLSRESHKIRHEPPTIPSLALWHLPLLIVSFVVSLCGPSSPTRRPIPLRDQILISITSPRLPEIASCEMPERHSSEQRPTTSGHSAMEVTVHTPPPLPWTLPFPLLLLEPAAPPPAG